MGTGMTILVVLVLLALFFVLAVGGVIGLAYLMRSKGGAKQVFADVSEEVDEFTDVVREIVSMIKQKRKDQKTEEVMSEIAQVVGTSSKAKNVP